MRFATDELSRGEYEVGLTNYIKEPLTSPILGPYFVFPNVTCPSLCSNSACVDRDSHFICNATDGIAIVKKN